MATCVVNDLIAANPCYAALQPFEQDVVLTQMLCDIVDKLENGGVVTCDIQTLLTEGKCFAAMPRYVLKATQLQLLCNLLNAL